MEWFTVDPARVRGRMNATRQAIFDAWLAADPANADMAATLVRGVVAEFRSGLESNPLNVLVADVNQVPITIVRNVETLCLAELYGAMGVVLTQTELELTAKAETYKRMMFTGKFFLTGGDGGVAGTPSYEPSPARPERATEGW